MLTVSGVRQKASNLHFLNLTISKPDVAYFSAEIAALGEARHMARDLN